MNYILQHLQEFTVKVLGRDKKSTLGTGFVVKSDGEVVRILTVAHVIQDILKKHPRQAIGDSIFVSFPLVPAQEERIQEAKIVACFVNYDDDLVMLGLARGDPRPIAYQNAAQLGTAKDSLNDRFISYGYPHGQSYPEGVTDGLILEIQNAVGSGHYKARWAKIKTEKYSMRIVGGMSGAPVLDKRRNLVVGMIIGFWKRKTIAKDKNDENFAASIDCKVLKFDPFNLPIESRVLGLEPGSRPKIEIESNKLIFRKDAGTMLLGAPDALPHWVGRENILESLDQDWKKPHCNVTGLIGLGGEGKSSLARRWQERVSSYSGEFQFNGVLWWNFYNNRNVDEFFATALEFLTKKKQATIIYTTKRRADIVANILETGRYLFVLDGLEVMQYQGGNQYGKIESKVLRNFLLTFASKETDSRTLVTSRVQLLDLLNYASYHEIRLDQLTLEEGRALLKKLGVQAPNAIIDRIVQYWNGHALSLTLVGNYLTESKSQFGFDERYWARSKNKDGYQKIRRILYRYDEFMTFEDRIFLQFFSAFRSSINQAGLSKIIRQSKLAFIQPLRRMTSLRFQEMIERLINRGLIKPIDYAKTREKLNKVGERSGFLEAHPLIREYYYSQIPIKVKPEVNLFLAKYTHTLYKPQIPKKLNTIKPLIDEVHYLCEAAQYDKAYRLYDRIIDVIPKSKSGFDEDESGFLVYKIGAYETELNMLREFFPQGNLSLNPCVSKLPDRVTVLVSVGLDVSFLGEPHTAISINRRAGQLAIQCGERKHATWAYQNIADDYAKIGRLHDGIPVCKKEIKLAEHFNGSLTEKSGGFMRLGWIYFLLGNVGAAERSFATAEALRPKNDPDPIPWTWSYGEGIWFATYLARTGQFKKASTVSKANLHYSTIDEEQDSIIGCLRSLGDIYRLQGKLQTAINLYSKAIKLASANGLGEEITLAYLGRGLMFMDSGETDESQIDLEQALDASISFGYRLWEFDVRNALIKLSVLRNLNNVSLLSTLTQDVHKILSAAQKHNYKWAEGDAYQCLGRIALQQRDYITGKEYLSRALQIREKTRDVRLPETLTAVEMLNI